MSDDAEKRRIKAEYRNLGHEVNDNEDEMVRPDSDALVNILTKGNDLFSSVITANEGSEDSKLIAQIAHIGVKKIQELKTDASHFSANEFTSQLAAYTLQGEDGELTSDHWSILGNAVQAFFNRPPTFTYLLGTFPNQPVAKKEVVKRARVKDDNTKDVRTHVKKVADDDQEKLETTADDVTKRVLPVLIKLYNHNGKAPIDYYEFVIDPDSFGVTIENMFHVSFLIRDGFAEIKLDDDGLPAIKPTVYGLDPSNSEAREQELQCLPRRQVINQITMQQWANLKTTFHIKKARIPRRK